MIMPGTVGDRWFIGFQKLHQFFSFRVIYFIVVFTALSKVPLPKKKSFYRRE
jgi:hypothetical protein